MNEDLTPFQKEGNLSIQDNFFKQGELISFLLCFNFTEVITKPGTPRVFFITETMSFL